MYASGALPAVMPTITAGNTAGKDGESAQNGVNILLLLSQANCRRERGKGKARRRERRKGNLKWSFGRNGKIAHTPAGTGWGVCYLFRFRQTFTSYFPFSFSFLSLSFSLRPFTWLKTRSLHLPHFLFFLLLQLVLLIWIWLSVSIWSLSMLERCAHRVQSKVHFVSVRLAIHRSLTS